MVDITTNWLTNEGQDWQHGIGTWNKIENYLVFSMEPLHLNDLTPLYFLSLLFKFKIMETIKITIQITGKNQNYNMMTIDIEKPQCVT